MRTRLFCLGALLLVGLVIGAEESHTRYRTETDVFSGEGSGNAGRLTQTAEDRFSLPASLDPLGNWGFKVSGVQSSIRFTKHAYHVGEKTTATVIVRNTGDYPVLLKWLRPDTNNLIVISDNTKSVVQPRSQSADPFLAKLNAMTMNPKNVTIRPGYQRVFEWDLSEVFDLSQEDTYVVYSRALVSKNGGESYEDIRSANSLISVSQGRVSSSVTPIPGKNVAARSDTHKQPDGSASVAQKSTVANQLPGAIQSSSTSSTANQGDANSSSTLGIKRSTWLFSLATALVIIALFLIYRGFRRS